MFAPHFCAGERKYKCSLPAFASGRQKYKCSLPAFASGRRKYICSVAAFAVGNENTFVRCPLSRWGSSTRMGFRKKCFGTSKTFPGGARFRAGEAPPERVFVKNASGQAKPFRVMLTFTPGKLHPNGFLQKTRRVLPVSACFLSKRAAFCSSRRVFRQNAGRFPRPGVFSAKTRDVFLVSACFLPKREPFSSSRRIFCQNAGRFACPGVFSAKTRDVFPATKHFPRKRRLRLSKPPATDVCRAVAPARRGKI